MYFAIILSLGCIVSQALGTTYEAVAVIHPALGKTGAASGTVTFHQVDDGEVHYEVSLTGLTPGLHGFHVHEKGDLSGGCATMGGHFNPDQRQHGGPNDSERHVGDLGNVRADENGRVQLSGSDGIISLHGRYSIIGRGVVVHSGEDDLGKGGQPDSLTTGHAGDRVGCGVVGLKSPVNSASAPNSIGILVLVVGVLVNIYHLL